MGHFPSERWITFVRDNLGHFPSEFPHEGVWQLFGHVHSGSDETGYDIPRLKHLLPFQYDVGVDNNDDRPVSFQTLKEIMKRRKGV